MNQFKRTPVVMLPTNNKAIIGLNSIHNYLSIANNMAEIPSQQYQHLYFLSEDEIKKGDYYISDNQSINKALYNLSMDDTIKKIIATTDTSLKYIVHDDTVPYPKGIQYVLSQPSNQFITKYIKEYNKGNIITEVLVEYEVKQKFFLNEDGKQDAELILMLKVNSSDNTITIKKLKDSWNREEVNILLNNALDYKRSSYENYPGLRKSWDKEKTDWIKENL